MTGRRATPEPGEGLDTASWSLFNAVSDGLAIRDHDGVIVEVNPAFCALYGYPREERWPPMTNLEGFTTLPPWWRAAAGAAPTHDSRDDIAARKTKA